jgi:hypothetical protein
LFDLSLDPTKLRHEKASNRLGFFANSLLNGTGNFNPRTGNYFTGSGNFQGGTGKLLSWAARGAKSPAFLRRVCRGFQRRRAIAEFHTLREFVIELHSEMTQVAALAKLLNGGFLLYQARDTPAGQDESLDFSALSEFLVGTAG